MKRLWKHLWTKWLNRKIATVQIIRGCEGRGDGDSPYMTRYNLWRGKRGALRVHVFHRSDHDVMHDHPWSFWTIILWRGYIEETPGGSRRLWPGQIVFRPAEWVHRVVLLSDKPAVTLVWSGGRKRSWYFHTPDGLVHWREYFKWLGC